jgi:hypothetical protein
MIPESQFDTWARQGATTKAQTAHHSIRDALDQWKQWSDGVKFDTYLQGSYRNSTNIWRDSDVDLVVELTSIVRYDTSQLTVWELQQFNSSTQWVSYGWLNFRNEVLSALNAYYGSSRVDPSGKKSIKVGGFDGLVADVVVCMKLIKYFSYPFNWVEGMTFHVPSEYRWVENYPKLHCDKGEQKNLRNDWYKPTVRIFKNIKRYMVDRGLLPDGIAPSYFLECMLYNVPDNRFNTNYRTTFSNVLSWLLNANLANFQCQNEQMSLFGYKGEQWRIEHAKTYLKALSDLDKSW